jgi:hypothetical protein
MHVHFYQIGLCSLAQEHDLILKMQDLLKMIGHLGQGYKSCYSCNENYDVVS